MAEKKRVSQKIAKLRRCHNKDAVVRSLLRRVASAVPERNEATIQHHRDSKPIKKPKNPRSLHLVRPKKYKQIKPQP